MLKHLQRLWAYLVDLFWIPRLKRLAASRREFQYRFLVFYAWMALSVYVVGLPLTLVQGLIHLEFIAVFGALLGAVIFPWMVRLLIVVVSAMNGLSLKEPQ